MFVVRQAGPHAAVDAVADAGEVGSWCFAVFRRRVQGREDEFGGVEFGHVGLECAGPGGRGIVELMRCC